MVIFSEQYDPFIFVLAGVVCSLCGPVLALEFRSLWLFVSSLVAACVLIVGGLALNESN